MGVDESEVPALGADRYPVVCVPVVVGIRGVHLVLHAQGEGNSADHAVNAPVGAARGRGRVAAGATAFTAEFQDLITRYAWGEIWTRPGLDWRTRSCVTLTALVAGGHHDELAMHVRAALRNGLTPDDIKEVLLQTAIHCGVPAANTAFKIAQRVLDDHA